MLGVAERNAIVVIWIALKINKIRFGRFKSFCDILKNKVTKRPLPPLPE